jgi:GPH family glycoside/pentoside/hexuronide:cation symporter
MKTHTETKSVSPPSILRRRTKFPYGMSGFGQSIIEDVVNNTIYLFYNTQLMVDGRLIAGAFLGTRLWDAVSDPLMGYLSDNTRSRWGRRRPYIFIGCFLMALSFFAMCVPPRGMSERGLTYYLGVIAFLYFTFYTITVIPSVGLGAELTPDYHERTRLFAYRSLLGRVGGMAAGASEADVDLLQLDTVSGVGEE